MCARDFTRRPCPPGSNAEFGGLRQPIPAIGRAARGQESAKLTLASNPPVSRLPRPLPTSLAALAAAAVLAACAAWSDVREVASGVPLPAYELRGAKLATLQAEALRLCLAGYEITRSWQRYGQPSDTWWSRWAIQATDYNGLGDRQAFLAIVCKDEGGAASAPASATPALVPVPAALPMPTSSPPPTPVPNAPPPTAPVIVTPAPAPASAPH